MASSPAIDIPTEERRDSQVPYSSDKTRLNDNEEVTRAPPTIPDQLNEDGLSSHGSSTTTVSDNFKLEKLCLVPKALPPIYQTKSKKPVPRPWDYPLAGSVRTPPDRLDREGRKSEVTFSDQLEDLRHCRYLRIAPNKSSKKGQVRPKAKKDGFFMVVAGRSGPAETLAVHVN